MLKTELKNKNISCIVPKIKINYIIVVKNCEKFESIGYKLSRQTLGFYYL